MPVFKPGDRDLIRAASALCETTGRPLYANRLDILYSFSARGTLYSALMGTLVSNEKSDGIRCFEYRTCANFCSFIILPKFVSLGEDPWWLVWMQNYI